MESNNGGMMPSKQVWIAKNPKEVECYSCVQEHYITVDFQAICVRMRLNGKLVAWHPECWLRVYIPLVESSASLPGRPGRRILDLSVEDKRERLKLQKRYAACTQKLRLYQQRTLDSDLSPRQGRILMQRQQLMQDFIYIQIGAYGGPPDGWRKPKDGEAKRDGDE